MIQSREPSKQPVEITLHEPMMMGIPSMMIADGTPGSALTKDASL